MNDPIGDRATQTTTLASTFHQLQPIRIHEEVAAKLLLHDMQDHTYSGGSILLSLLPFSTTEESMRYSYYHLPAFESFLLISRTEYYEILIRWTKNSHFLSTKVSEISMGASFVTLMKSPRAPLLPT